MVVGRGDRCCRRCRCDDDPPQPLLYSASPPLGLSSASSPPSPLSLATSPPSHSPPQVISVSKTSDPLGGWVHYYLAAAPSGAPCYLDDGVTVTSCIPDYPQFALYNGYMVLTHNEFGELFYG